MKKSGNPQSNPRGSLLLSAAGFTAIAVHVRNRRRAERRYGRLSSEVEDKLDRRELTDEQAFALVANARRESAARQCHRSVAVFVVAVGLLMPFLSPFPLNPWFRPWGEFALAICLCTFLLAVFALSEMLSEWLARRHVEKGEEVG